MECIRLKKGFGLKTYEPEKRFEIHKETIPFMSTIFQYIGSIPDSLALVFYSIAIFAAGIFKAKDLIARFSLRKERVLDLRRARRNLVNR